MKIDEDKTFVSIILITIGISTCFGFWAGMKGIELDELCEAGCKDFNMSWVNPYFECYCVRENCVEYVELDELRKGDGGQDERKI